MADDRQDGGVRGWMRGGVSLAIAVIVCPGITVAVMSFGAAFPVGVAVSLLVFGLLSMLGKRIKLPTGAGRGVRVLFAVWLAVSLVAGYRTVRLGMFMHDATAAEYAYRAPVRDLPDPKLTKPFLPKHNCFTCYMVAADLASEGVDNIYSPMHYRDPETESRVHKTIGDVLHIDRYQYPPPFLVLPGLLRAVTTDFFHARALWFGINLVLLAITFLWLVAWVDRWTFRSYWLLWPALLVASTMVGTLQIGNAHLFIVLLIILAFLAFESRRFALGGAFLGFGVVGKIFPGVLLLYLLAQRRWRAVIWTCVAVMAFTGTAFFVYGIGPFEAFLTYQMDRLSSGDAFSFAFENLRPMMVNGSVHGVAYKLAKLGVFGEADAPDIARGITMAFTLFLVVSTIRIGLRQARRYKRASGPNMETLDRLRMVRLWIAFIVLAQLRSPFLPWGYGNVAIICLIFVVLPLNATSLRRLWWAIPMWAIFSTPIPLFFGPATPTFDLIFTLTGQALALVICLVVVTREALAPRDVTVTESTESDFVSSPSPYVSPAAVPSKIER